jgi:hypothetical protein
MKVSKKKVARDLLDLEGFVFVDGEPFTSRFRKDVLKEKSPTCHVMESIDGFLKSYDLPISGTQIVYETYEKGDGNNLHSHLLPADLQLLIWVPEKDVYQGRDFLYGKADGRINSLKPRFGDVCFMKTNDLSFVHGVSSLETEMIFKTIIVSINYSGSKGEHLTVSADDLDPI